MDLNAQLAAYKEQVAEGTLTAEEGKLRALKALSDAGVLTADEFNTQKKAVLSGWVAGRSAAASAPVVRQTPQTEPEYEFADVSTAVIGTSNRAVHTRSISKENVWVMALVPLVSWFVEMTGMMDTTWGIETGLYIVMTIQDRKVLKEAGCATLPHWGWGVFLPPVYLWKRSTMLQQSRETFWVWVASVALYALWSV